MSNTHFSLTTKKDQESMASRGSRRIHAFSKKTNKTNGPAQRVMLHGSAEEVLNMKEYVCEAELVSSTSTRQKVVVVESGRERLKRHREEMGGQVSIPDKWGQEELLKDWIDCSSFEALLVPNKIAAARKALVADQHGRSRAVLINSG